MTIRRLFNHRAVAYRATTVRDQFGDEVETWAAVTGGTPAGLNCRPNQNWSGTQQDHGPGEQQGAKRQWFLDPDFDVAEGDVLDVIDGPESPTRLHVESVSKPARARGPAHHIEVNVEVWPNDLDGAA